LKVPARFDAKAIFTIKRHAGVMTAIDGQLAQPETVGVDDEHW
jgi:hypothetical protein